MKSDRRPVDAAATRAVRGPDLVVRGGRIVTPDGVLDADLAVMDGRIMRIAPGLDEEEGLVLDARGKYVFPGIVDAHVHFNEPGRTGWEDFATGSAALAAGGGTCFFDQPSQCLPPTLDAAALREKRRLAEEKSCVDFALWGGLVAGNLDQLAALRDAGAIGFKAYLGPGTDEKFPVVDAAVLREGMKRAAKLGVIVAVHAEDASTLAKSSTAKVRTAKRTAAAWGTSRPIEAELAAIRCALELAGETGCVLHIASVSSLEGLELIEEARQQRVDVTAETTPHHLLLNASDVARLGVVAKSAPPVRDEAGRAALWKELRSHRIQTIGSAHSPTSPEPKAGKDFSGEAAGVAGCQHGFSLLMSEVATSADKDLPILAAVLARNVARRFRIDQHKGLLTPGRDADFSLVEFGAQHAIKADELWTRQRLSVYVGRKSRARVTHTYVRGAAVLAAGRLVNLAPPGRFVRPTHA